MFSKNQEKAPNCVCPETSTEPVTSVVVSVNGQGFGNSVENVSFGQVSIPEPSTLLMTIAGGAVASAAGSDPGPGIIIVYAFPPAGAASRRGRR